jgi:predicted small lipoprotein YifL
MRTKSILIAALALLTLAAGCKRKGGGYLAPTPVPANQAR